jgi:hypothetical protein
MAKLARFDFSEFKKLAGCFQAALNNNVIDKFIQDFLLEMAFRAERKIKKRTPVGVYGTKEVSFISKPKVKQVKFRTKSGKEVNFTANIKSKNVQFTARSNKTGGHLRRNWQVGSVTKQGDAYMVEVYNNVEYASFIEFGHRTRNHRRWVEGRFMATISMQEMERELPKFLGKRQEELLNQILNGKFK